SCVARLRNACDFLPARESAGFRHLKNAGGGRFLRPSWSPLLRVRQNECGRAHGEKLAVSRRHVAMLPKPASPDWDAGVFRGAAGCARKHPPRDETEAAARCPSWPRFRAALLVEDPIDPAVRTRAWRDLRSTCA